MGTIRKSRIAWVSAMLLFTAAPGPAPAAAAEPDAVLYELNEAAQFTSDNRRLAESGLEGKARRRTPLCPEGLMAYAEVLFATLGITVQDASRCTVVAFGWSDLDLGTFGGAIGGDFYVVVNSDATNLVDAPELVVMAGTFSGAIQVSDPDGLIIAITSGTFTPTSTLPGFPLPAPATFTGTFRLPFKVHHLAVYKKDSGQPVPVRPDERALGDPTVRVEITFD